MKIIVFVTSLILFAGSSHARSVFSMDDYYRLKRTDQRRFLGAVNQFYIEFEKAQKKYGFKSEAKKKRYFKYYNSMNFILQMMIEQAEAEGKKLCVNNGIIAEVSDNECKSSTNWGFNMDSHIKGLVDAGLKVSCSSKGEEAQSSGSLPAQGCGIVGLKSDLTLACSSNRTSECISQGDSKAVQAVLKACKPDSNGESKSEAEVAVGDTKKTIKCDPLIKHMEDQMQMMAFTCHSDKVKEEFSSRLNSSVKAVCEKTMGQLETITAEINGFGDVQGVVGPQATDQKNLRIIGNEALVKNDFGGSLNQCLSGKKYNVSQYAAEDSKRIGSNGDPVRLVHKSKGAFIKETGAGDSVSYVCKSPCKEEPVVETDEAPVNFFEMDEGEKYDTGILFSGKGVVGDLEATQKITNIEEREKAKKEVLDKLKALTQGNVKKLSEFSGGAKGCHLATPIIEDPELRKRWAADIRKTITEAAKTDGKDNMFCNVIQSNDVLNRVMVDKRKPAMGEEDAKQPKSLSSSEWQTLGQEVCQEIDKGGKPPAEETKTSSSSQNQDAT